MDVTKAKTPTSPASDVERWYVLTAFKQEIHAKSLLEDEARRQREAGLAPWRVFLPMVQALHGTEGHKRRVTKPLLPNFAFVRARLHDLYLWKQQYPFIRFYRPAMLQDTDQRCVYVPDLQMESFITVVKAQQHLGVQIFRPGEIDLHKGDHVRITSGPFEGVEGTLLVEQGRPGGSVLIELQHVATIRTLYIEPEFIQVLSFADEGNRLYKHLANYFKLALSALSSWSSSGSVPSPILSRLVTSRQRLSALSLTTASTRATLTICHLITAYARQEITSHQFEAQLSSQLPNLPSSKRNSLTPLLQK